MINIYNIERNKNKNKYNKILINKWTNWTTQSNNETIFEMLYELSTKQLNKIVTHSTVHIQQQYTDIHRNLIISSRIWQRHANKHWNDQI